MIRIIVITPEEIMPGEGAAICRMLAGGAWRVHVRHPQASAAEIEKVLADIPAEKRADVSLHDHFELAAPMGVGGVHLNRRNPRAPQGWKGIVSCSCHSREDVEANPEADYVFLSPIFNSISKPGYESRFTPQAVQAVFLNASGKGGRIFALGGVTRRLIPFVEELGFGGAAMLGAAWHPFKADDFRLQYITPAADSLRQLVIGVEQALMGGCRWVQLRMKDASDVEVTEAAKLIAPLCRRYKAVFILDDHAGLVNAADADGVHLGKNDMPVAEARRLLGPGAIVGATANTLADMEAAFAAGADYIGLGPLRFTATKKNLSPTLGVEGYATLMAEARRRGINIPVVAIGGITADDIAGLAATGIDGVAVSGAIAEPSPTTRTKEFVKQLNTHIKCRN